MVIVILFSDYSIFFMRLKHLYGLAIASIVHLGNANAQCTTNVTTAVNCYPKTITASSNFSADTLKWYKNDTLVHTSFANAANNGAIVAGGSGQGNGAGQFNFPNAIFVDDSMNVYVSDLSNHRVQKWAPNATAGITVAGGNGNGNGLNQLNFPTGMYRDMAGNIYVCEAMNHRVTKWVPNATAGIVVAGGNGNGNGSDQLSFPGGIFVKGNDIYIADAGNHRIQKWSQNAVNGVTVAGGNGWGAGLNQLMLPQMNGAVFVDGSDNVYISEYSNNRIVKWAPNAASGVLVAGGNGQGNAANQFNNPCGFIVTNNGLYVSEYGNNRVTYWANNATAGTTVAGGNGVGNQLNQTTQPVAVFLKNNHLYVSEYGNHRVNKISLSGWIDSTYTINSPGTYKVVANNNTCNDTGIYVETLPASIALLAPSMQHICQGSSYTLHATAHAAINYQWLKDGQPVGNNADSLVATAEGLYAVVTSVNGNCQDTSATCHIMIEPLPDPVIVRSGMNLTTDNGFVSYQWYKNGNAILGAILNTHIADEPANYAVWVTGSNGCSNMSDTVNVSGGTSIGEMNRDIKFQLYTNPASNTLSLKFPLEYKEIIVNITDAQGRILISNKAINATKTTVQIQELSQGMYFINANCDGVSFTRKFIKY